MSALVGTVYIPAIVGQVTNALVAAMHYWYKQPVTPSFLVHCTCTYNIVGSYLATYNCTSVIGAIVGLDVISIDDTD